jgi:pimeloyl-ACP methyl ester carboxylesterase
MDKKLSMRQKLIFRKFCIAAITIFVVTYGLMSTYIYARQAHFIFKPKRIISKTPSAYQLPFEDVFIPVADENEANQRIHAWNIPAEYPTNRYLIYLHGSALNIVANIPHARRFRNLGFSVLLISYRGYGKSDGIFPNEDQVYADAQAAWTYLVDKKKVDPGRIFIYGHSLGGAVAIQLAIDNPSAAGLIVEAAFTSIPEMARQISRYRIFPIDFIVHQRFESHKKVDSLQLPVLYIHGTDDELVPYQMSLELYNRTPSLKHLKLIPGGGHNNSAAVGGDEYLKAVGNFIAFTEQTPREKNMIK